MAEGKGIDLATQLSFMHNRNMTQLPMGNKYPHKQQIIDQLDSKTKIELLTHSN